MRFVGSLTLPGGGLIYLDANALIYSVERVEPYRTLLSPMWRAAEEGDVTVASSGLTVVEALVRPIRDGNEEIEAQYREVFEASVFRVLDMPLVAFKRAAQIRVRSQLNPGHRHRRSAANRPSESLRSAGRLSQATICGCALDRLAAGSLSERRYRTNLHRVTQSDAGASLAHTSRA